MRATHAAVYFGDDGYWHLQSWFPDGSSRDQVIEDVPRRDPTGNGFVVEDLCDEDD